MPVRRAVLAVLALAACGQPTRSVCPTRPTLTYENFGRGFMGHYCVRCHAADLVGDARHGAPSSANLDRLAGVKDYRAEVDALAAAGPHVFNSQMPPSGELPEGATPLGEERRRLGEWLACGAP